MDAAQRRQLRKAVQRRYPWVADDEVGPAAVEAGECDGCGSEARLVQTCGPGSYQFLGRRCAVAIGGDAWCAGHAAEASALLAKLAHLPAEADTVARVWWVATGEVRLGDAAEHLERLRLSDG